MAAASTYGARVTGMDRWAIGVSGLCAVHCLTTTALLALASAAGGVLFHPLVHEAGLVLAIVLGALGLGRGAATHGAVLPASLGALGLGIMAGALALPHGADGHASAGHGMAEHGEALWTVIGLGLLTLAHLVNGRMDDRPVR